MIRSEQYLRVALLTIDRPEKRNALNVQQCERLEAAVVSARASAHVIIITGEGTAFCSGADLDAVYGDCFLDALYNMLNMIYATPIPVIAAVNGPAIGAGLQLALACDLRVAASEARFGLPTAKLGLAVDQQTIQRLASLGGGSLARRLLLTAEVVDQPTAIGAGLVDRSGSLEDAGVLAAEMAALAPLSLSYSKQVLNSVTGGAQDPALAAAFQDCWASEDLREGRSARSENRSPMFVGR